MSAKCITIALQICNGYGKYNKLEIAKTTKNKHL